MTPSRVGMVLLALVGAATAGTVAIALAAGPVPAPAEPAHSRATAAAPVASSPEPVRGATPTQTPAQPPSVPVPAPSAPAAARTKAPPLAAGLVAVAGVVDGDTIKVRLNGTTERVRVIGIDTPELSTRECYAQQAASAMQSWVQSTSVRLGADPSQDDRDRYGRLLRHVYLADGRSVAQLLIAGGFGREYTYDDAYAGQTAHLEAQRDAQGARLGIWGSGCAIPAAPVQPAAPQPAAPPPAAPQDCTIKGNISSEGEKIYHVPGGAFYEQTRISLSKGERWFCSESEAVDAGWRASLR